MAVFVWDRHKRPLMACSEKRARLLLARGRAVVHKHYPFTIRRKDRVNGETQPLRLGIDPGSKTTGLTLMRETDSEQWHVLCLFDLVHRGFPFQHNTGFFSVMSNHFLASVCPRWIVLSCPEEAPEPR